MATEHCGQIDPTDLDEYLRHDGFEALEKVLEELTPEEIIEQIEASGLRGRGGAGFPDGPEMGRRACAEATPKKYVVCNGDEGDPGAFMDRMLLESFPYRIIEGMAIAARCVGARRGLSLHPRRVSAGRRAGHARRWSGAASGACWASACWARTSRSQLEDRGRGGGVRLRRRDGADGLDRRPARHAAAAAAVSGRSGLWGKPTLVNNVETYALRAVDHPPRRRGVRRARHRQEQGHEGLRPGRQGRARRADRSADGRHDPADRRGDRRRRRRRADSSRPCRSAGRPAAASRPNWPTRPSTTRPWPRSGRSWAPAAWSCWTTPTAWSISPATSSASPRTSRAASVRSAASARGGCSTSSTASARARARRRTSTSSSSWPTIVKPGSICGLGKTAPNPVLSTLRYFRDEYEAHLAGRCPAGKCKALIRYRDHRRLHRLHALRPAVPGRRHPDDAVRETRDRPGKVHPVRDVQERLSVEGGSRAVAWASCP